MSKKNLIFDVGNSRTKVAIVDNDKIVYRDVIPYLNIPYLKNLKYNRKGLRCIYGVTGHLSDDVEAYIKRKFKPAIRLSGQTPLPIVNNYSTPLTLGVDRIAGVVGAYSLFEGIACLVIDAGTSITYDILSTEGAFLGGNISPGLKMRMRAMNEFTSSLPLVEIGKNKLENWIGYDTHSALLNGGALGAVLEMRGFIAKCRRKFAGLKVIITGGDKDFFVNQIKSEIFAHPDLVALGMNKILNYNAEIHE